MLHTSHHVVMYKPPLCRRMGMRVCMRATESTAVQNRLSCARLHVTRKTFRPCVLRLRLRTISWVFHLKSCKQKSLELAKVM